MVKWHKHVRKKTGVLTGEGALQEKETDHIYGGKKGADESFL